LSSREPGSVLDGKYEIVQRLGSGGMGEVYLVRHIHLQELRVVKILRQDLQADPAAQKRFMREARLATQIKHPNVAILYDFSTLPDGSFYMVWEHIQGKDVGEWIRDQGPFPVPQAVQLGVQALRGLDAIHASGVIHRDLSPDNLMITEDKQGQRWIKIIDLGLARNLEADAGHEITQVGMFMGKLQYCSPEQASPAGGDGLDRRSDLYSFALVLYEMIVGRPPFESESQAGFIFKRLSEDPLPLIGRNPKIEVPAELDRVVRKALERDREKRYPDAATFIRALERVGQSISGAETREIPVSAFLAAAALEETGSRVRTPTPPREEPPPRQRSSSELTRTERDELLAQIDRAARRVQETSVDLSRAEAALGSGRLDEAQQLIAQIEAANPRTQGLQRLKDRLAEERDAGERRRRVAETEQVLANYVQRKQLPLARLALETLAELDPQNPRRAEYEGSLARLGQELERDKRVEAALAAGRQALARRDLIAARRELDIALRNDPAGKRSDMFRVEVENAETEAQRSVQIDERRRRFDQAVAEGRTNDARLELAELERLEVSRVTLDSLRERLDEARSHVQSAETVSWLEMRYRRHLEDRDWLGARDAALEMEKTDPRGRRAAQMYAEVSQLEAAYQRRQAIEQGVRQIETFLEQRDAAKAELALKVLLQMDPDNRERKRLEKQVKALRG
jgi:serine/threonine-protein kinase